MCLLSLVYRLLSLVYRLLSPVPHLTPATRNNPDFTDTIVMANLGYLQLKAAPGAWFLNLREGRSSDIYDIVGQVTTLILTLIRILILNMLIPRRTQTVARARRT